MTDAQRLLAEYIAEHRSGGDPDPGGYVARASPTERSELVVLIDATLRARRGNHSISAATAAPPRSARSRTSIAHSADSQGCGRRCCPSFATEPGSNAASSSSASPPPLASAKRRARSRATTTRWNRTAPCLGVSDRVLEALGQIIGETAEALREAGLSPRSRETGTEAARAAFARRAYPESPAGPPPAAATRGEAPEWDEVDQLFRGA
jgi:hypothetical protein